MDRDLIFAAYACGRWGHCKDCLKDGVDWVLENLFSGIELVITGTVFQITVLVALR